jgi:hypothetical protein
VPVHREEIYQRIKREERMGDEAEGNDYSSDHDYRGADYFGDEDSIGNK